MGNKKHIIYGIISGLGILAFYILVLTFFQGFGFAISQFKQLWIWLVPLAAGFGTQIGLFSSIKHTAQMNATIAGTGTISGGSMIACCSHFLLNIVPIIGLSGLATFLMTYQKTFFSIGIISSIIGITLMVTHKNKMKGGKYRWEKEK